VYHGRIGKIGFKLVAVPKKVCDLYLKKLRRKRLLYISIGTMLEAIYLGLQRVDRGKQYDRYVAKLDASFHRRAKLKAVHYRHHHIADHEMHNVILQNLQRFQAIGST